MHLYNEIRVVFHLRNYHPCKRQNLIMLMPISEYDESLDDVSYMAMTERRV
jgi:hypothetical protein